MMKKYAAVSINNRLLSSSLEEALTSAKAMMGVAADWMTQREFEMLGDHSDEVVIVKAAFVPKLVRTSLRDVLCPNGQENLFIDSFDVDELDAPRFKYEMIRCR